MDLSRKSVILGEGLLGDATLPLYSHGRLLKCLMRSNSNAIRRFSFPDWIPIDFQMKWSKVGSNNILNKFDYKRLCQSWYSYRTSNGLKMSTDVAMSRGVKFFLLKAPLSTNG